MSDSFFSFFRKQPVIKGKVRDYEEVFFQIAFDASGAFLQVTDENAKPVEVSYLNYAGATRNLLRTLENIQDKNSFVINWENPEDKIYLKDYPFLMDALRLCDNIIDPQKLFIRFASTMGEMRLRLNPIKDKKAEQQVFQAKTVLQYKDEAKEGFRIINESYVLLDNQIVEIEPLGSGFANLRHFETKIFRKDFPLYFSLLFSNLDHLKVSCNGFRFVFSRDEKVKAQPCLFFEKVDEQNALYLRVGQSLPGLDIMALQQFELYRFAEVNDLEKIITIKLIEQEPTESYLSEIEKLLKRCQPKKKKAEQEEIFIDPPLFVIPGETAANFIYGELPNLLMRYTVFGAEKLKSYKINTKAPKLKANLGHNIDFFEGEVVLDFDGEEINIFDVINQYKKQRYVQLSNGSHALLNEKYVKRLERLFKKGKNKKAELSFFDLPAAEDLINEVANQKVFEQSRAIYEGFNHLQKQKPAIPKINATLRPYQKQGYQWLDYLRQHQLGGCLADDMGLGKTIQAIALLAADYPEEEKPSLIVMPKSLLYNWESEVARFAPQLSTYIFYGLDRDLAEAKKHHLILTTYAIMRNEIERLKEEDFHYIILDESQNIKNLKAQTTQAALMLRSKHRLALSGTPIENNLGELYSLFRFLNPRMFGSTTRFNEDYLVPIQKHNNQDATRALRQKIYPFVLRRLKKEVLDDLPDKIEQILTVDMNPEQHKLYHQRRAFYEVAIKQQIATKGIQSSQFFIFQALNELRQIATVPEGISEGRVASAKLDLLTEQLFDAIANGHKVLIFVNFLAAIESIGKELVKMNIDFVSMTGATRDRQSLVNRFQNDPECKVFLMTLKTGGVGLNLTAADTIFIYDPWWNKAAENQAIDRAHRIGQTNKVLAYKLITKGTIEDKILKLQELKSELFDNVIASDSASLKSLTTEDIDLLLKD
ncbi:MAG TPA: DEAD/DEAH box helicase [Phaeodactylibacter sp.]|nr:DEAD/DEAH box helicase [Phaeodactylibacter sp.]